jgi:hypothetical protein
LTCDDDKQDNKPSKSTHKQDKNTFISNTNIKNESSLSERKELVQ